MKKAVTDFSESTLIRIIEDSWIRAWTVFSRLPEAKLYNTGTGLWFTTGLSDSLLNAVMRVNLETDNVSETIEFLRHQFRGKSLPFSWHIGPATTPHNLGEYLIEQGFAIEEKIIGMAADLSHLRDTYSQPKGLEIIRVYDTNALGAWVNVLRIGYPLSDCFADAMLHILKHFDSTDEEINYHYLGILDGEPVASSTLSLSNGVASIYDVTVIPNVRGRGIGTAMTLSACLDARNQDYRIGVLQSSEMAISIYHRLGFQDYCKILRYVQNFSKI